MDHYPPVSNPYKPIIVPFLGGTWNPAADISCTDLELGTFRERLLARTVPPDEELRVMSTVQGRLFWGMLHSVLQTEISTSDYVIGKTKEDSCTLSTRMLKKDLARWKQEHDKLRQFSHSEIHDATSQLQVGNVAQQLEERRVKAEKCLNDAFKAWQMLEVDNPEVQGREREEDFQIVRLSIQVLGKTLEHAIESVSRYCDTCEYEPWVENASVPWRRHSKNVYLTNRMEGHGWCPTVIEALRLHGNIPLMYYTSLLGLPTRRGHKEAGCTAGDRGCRKLNIRSFQYKPLHTDDCPRVGCDFLGPGEAGMEELTNIIRKGRIPILYLDKNGEMKVAEQRRGREYTAISHVWADGLGHPENENLPGWRSNSILACQVRLIVKLMSKLPWTKALRTASEVYDDSVWKIRESLGARPSYSLEEMNETLYFWIDSICAPHNDAKGKAIAQMAAVYSRANRVLVLDSDLMATAIHAPAESSVALEVRPEFGAKLVGSAWQKRYWTLQEAVLAKRLWFQFKDDAYEKKTWADLVEHNFVQKKKQEAEAQGKKFDITQLPTPLPLPDRPNYEEYWWNDEICYYADHGEYQWGSLGIGNIPSERLPAIRQTCTVCPTLAYGACATCRALCARAQYVWRELKLRSCSVPTDKPVCIAILLDMDVSVFDGVTAEADRVEKLWEQYTVVPAGLLSLPSKKCKKAYLRWAPADLDCISLLGSPVWHPAHLTPRGVRVMLHGFTAKVTYALSPTSVIPVILGEMVYYIRNNKNYDNEHWVEGPAENRKSNVSFEGVTELGIILGQEPLGEGTPFPIFPASLGTLVAVKRREESDVLVVEYIGAVSIIGKDTMFERLTQTPWTTEEVHEKGAERLRGVPTPVNQKWLIEP